jgi:hypothetical protein
MIRMIQRIDKGAPFVRSLSLIKRLTPPNGYARFNGRRAERRALQRDPVERRARESLFTSSPALTMM